MKSMLMGAATRAAALMLHAGLEPAFANPPIEAYGEHPEIRSLAISPNGQRFAYLMRKDGAELLVVSEVGGKILGGARVPEEKTKAHGVFFASDNHAVVTLSETASMSAIRGKWEHSGAVSYNIETKKMKVLLGGTRGLFPAQSGLGNIVGRLAGTDEVFMPAYMGDLYSKPDYSLLKVDLNTGNGRVVSKGSPNTIDWIVDDKGTILAREEFDYDDKYYKIFTKREGGLDVVYSEMKTQEPTYGLLGVAEDASALFVGSRPDGAQFYRVSKMSFDGKVSAPIFVQPTMEPESILSDGNRRVVGVRYSGMYPTYEFFDTGLTATIEAIASMFPDAATYLTDWTADYSKIIVHVSGGAKAPAYYLYDRPKNTISLLARPYVRVKDEDAGPVTTIEYKARDGRKIPSLLTRPPGVDLGKKLPLIVMPHGGPEAYDAVGFDWMAQYFANRGYLVLQPNFRGSDGFGAEHRDAGYGEWGGKMQDDVTDGVKALIKMGWADANRICIIGGSYGGYAALAGGAYTPELYKCVAAIAPVSDLAAMLAVEKRESGEAVYKYWTKLIGDRRKDKAKIDAISPVNAAANFAAPVLLIHGVDDTVVPYNQSTMMESALKKAGKSVRLVKLKGEDHWLSVNDTRLQTLRELDAFVSAAIGPH
jgi:acetyl esterase/lipase